MRYIISSLLISFVISINYFYGAQIKSSDFENWQKKYGYFKTDYERQYRQMIYNKNKERILEHNSKQDETYRMEENQFMTLTHEEFVGIYLNEIETSLPQISILNKDLQSPLKAVDWRNYTTVYNQGSCVAGWAFSVSSSIEAWHYIRDSGKNISVAVQQLIDCDKNSFGCKGGQNTNAMLYVLQEGLYHSQNYPYIGFDQACKATKSGNYSINNYTFVGGSSQQLQSSLQYYPVSVGLDATNWQFYSSGLFSNCSDNQTNHYALAVGFDSNYNWVVQNSFGTGWGENGIIKLLPNNTCGILNQAYQIY
ncbi:unnamed protein product [Paramecium sonneborni]|uniref:cathepsin L n=1 Tax=Paramecium sonneborni TaxID=65129 RepID=A0A8S1NWN2_9CILI|nr:unnamed protein product [Paramecium sonneborni]